MDKQAFEHAREIVLSGKHYTNGIGTLSEKTMHAVLKLYFEPHSDNQEIKLGSYVADIVGENGIIEIQTRNFSSLRPKLKALLEVAPVTVVYPIPAIKWISWIDQDTQEVSKRHKSPQKGAPCQAFYELYFIRDMLQNERLRVILLMLEVDEYRNLNGWSKDKKRGSSRCDRIPLDILDEMELGCGGYGALLPDGLPEQFTLKAFKEVTKLSQLAATRGIAVLKAAGVIEQCGKDGRAFLYCRTT